MPMGLIEYTEAFLASHEPKVQYLFVDRYHFLDPEYLRHLFLDPKYVFATLCMHVFMCTYLLLVPRKAFNIIFYSVSGKSEFLKELRSILAQFASYTNGVRRKWTSLPTSMCQI